MCISHRIPSRIVKGVLEEYVCLLNPVKGNRLRFPLEGQCIFVPMNIFQNKHCGGIKLFENIAHVVEDPNFCNKTFGEHFSILFPSCITFPPLLPPSVFPCLPLNPPFFQTGDCIGLPFSSIKRFPIIPPYGLPELAGWKMSSSTQRPSHAVNNRSKHTIVFIQQKKKLAVQKELVLQPVNDHQLDIHNIPLSPVEIVVS